jgi:hypothetical protein
MELPQVSSSRCERIPSISELPLSENDVKRFQSCEFVTPRVRHPPSKGSWSQSEDDKLLEAIKGKTNVIWESIAAQIPQHTAKQCRERWLVKLNPNVRRTPFEKWEDTIIEHERRKIGNHWAIIAQALPGRTACSIKNRYYTVLRFNELDPLPCPQMISVPGGVVFQSAPNCSVHS